MNTPKHIVAVAALVVDGTDCVLMIRNGRDEWEFPGGQVEEGEDVIAALQREVREETGIAITVGPLAGVYSNVQSGTVMLDFVCEPIGGELQTSEESLEVKWVPREEALQRTTLPVIRDRMRDMLEFEGQVVYRSYAFDAGEARTGYTIHMERKI